MDIQDLITEILGHLRGMWRYRWQMLLVAWLVALLAWATVFKLPDVFEASAKVSVDTNSLLPALTKGLTAGENLDDEVDLVSKAMLTRPNLAAVARQTDLDLRADTPQQMERLITGLQGRVSVKGGRDRIFSISYQDKSREKATDVVAALLNAFVESSLGAQGDDADMTERAIKSEIVNHEARLLKAEADLAEFKKRNLGYMPDNGTDYYTRLQAALATVEDKQRQIRLVRQRRDEIGRQLQSELSLLGSSANSAQAMASCSRAANVAELRGQLSALQVDYTDKHPRIVMLRSNIEALELECAEELAAIGGTIAVRDSSGRAGEANTVYQNLRLLLSNTEVELISLQEELRSGQQVVVQLRRDVDKIGTVETDLKKLNRDYGVIEGRHQELLRRWETLQSKKRLDPVTDTVQFNILEPPFASAVPVAPNRPLLFAAALLFAISAGGAVAFGLNQLNPVFFNRRTLARVAALPVLGSVSMIMSPRELATRRRKTIAWASANMVLLAMGVALIFLGDPISDMMRELTRGVF